MDLVLLKPGQNKKGRIYVWDAEKMVAAEKKSPLLVHPKQIFGPSLNNLKSEGKYARSNYLLILFFQIQVVTP